MSDIETRAVILDTRTDTQPDDIRTFTGRVVPWNTPTTLFPGLREQFAPGSVRIDPDQPPMLFRDHRTPIGRITALDDHDDGLHVTGHISATATGDDTLTLIRDGVLDRMSIGFEPVAADETRHHHPRGLNRAFPRLPDRTNHRTPPPGGNHGRARPRHSHPRRPRRPGHPRRPRRAVPPPRNHRHPHHPRPHRHPIGRAGP
ncbi:MAG: HK97 family phage prohead protease [Cutibacterium avidum]|nr:HK97 family phage prohead protease [Cutibacterium avidum]